MLRTSTRSCSLLYPIMECPAWNWSQVKVPLHSEKKDDPIFHVSMHPSSCIYPINTHACHLYHGYEFGSCVVSHM